MCRAQQAPPASGARILLLPRKVVTGERATLAVLDVNGRLTPGVTVDFSNGDKVTTDTTGRALFVAPLNPGVILASLEGRRGGAIRLAGSDPGAARGHGERSLRDFGSWLLRECGREQSEHRRRARTGAG